MISSDFRDSIRVDRVDPSGTVKPLPVTFSRKSFGDAYRVADARIDVGDDGRLALIVSARGSPGQGPWYQRVYRADADGMELTQIAELDSKRIGGMVDIAVDPRGDVFVLTTQGDTGGPDEILRIDRNLQVSRAVHVCAGRDPQSIDVDPSAGIWFTTMFGIFRATPAAGAGRP
ncbi:MAG: hypothetical protein HYY09_04195 [Firmicutes bacterium]|nr:hypothetical protein [Bacillota bacterium]